MATQGWVNDESDREGDNPLLETLLAQAQYQGLSAAVPCLRLGLRGVERLLFCWERLAAAR